MAEKKPWYRRLIESKDRNVILICVGIALLFWLTKALSEEYVHDYQFTVDYQLPENVSFVEPAREEIEARLSGRGWELLKASLKRRFSHLPVQVVRNSVTRTDIVTALYTHLGDYEIAVREVDADVINLQTDIVIERIVSVRLNGEVELASGYMYLDSVELIPSEVTISGPAALVEGIEEVSTEAIQPIALSENVERTLDLLPPGSSFVLMDPLEVKLTARVDQAIRIVRTMQPTIQGDTTGLEFALEDVTVEFTIPQKFIAKFDSLDPGVVIDINGIKDLKQAQSVDLSLDQTLPFSCRSKITPQSATIAPKGEPAN